MYQILMNLYIVMPPDHALIVLGMLWHDNKRKQILRLSIFKVWIP